MIDDKNYKEKFVGFTVVEISGESCANCLTLMPMLHEVCKERSIPLYHVEIGEDTVTKEIIERYDVQAVPTVLVLDGTELIAKVKGFQPQEIFEIWLDAKLEEYQNSKKQ